MKQFSLLCLALTAWSLNAQNISFKQQNTLFSGSYYSGVGLAVADMNGDKKDDIVHLNEGNMLFIDFQQHSGGQFTMVPGPTMSTGSEWAMCIGDVNNDGFNDVFTGGNSDGTLAISSSATSYAKVQMESSPIFIQGSNFADINNDGWLDIFACNDIQESYNWGNNGDGTYTLHNEWMDMATTPVSDNSGNYGTTWTDFDNDGDLDLYIAKCRQGVNDPTDSRRINALFVNDGNGNPVEIGATLTEAAFDALPTADADLSIDFPKEAANTPFKNCFFGYAPHGHDPMGVYDAAHFDVCFFTFTDAERYALDPADTAAINLLPPAGLLPEAYVPAIPIPQVGTLFIDTTSPEIAGTGAFTATHLYGSYAGKVNLYQPMVTKDFLLEKKNFEAPVLQPSKFDFGGKKVPTRYGFAFDMSKKQYRFYLTGFVNS